MALLDAQGARYRLIDHEPEGQTDRASALRGHAVRLAAKCLVVMLKHGKRSTKFVLAVMPGDYRLDMKAMSTLHGATYAGFASAADAERVSGCIPGTVLPFSFNAELAVVADADLFANPDMFFNAGRLDRSIAMPPEEYRRIAKPRVESIAKPG